MLFLVCHPKICYLAVVFVWLCKKFIYEKVLDFRGFWLQCVWAFTEKLIFAVWEEVIFECLQFAFSNSFILITCFRTVTKYILTSRRVQTSIIGIACQPANYSYSEQEHIFSFFFVCSLVCWLTSSVHQSLEYTTVQSTNKLSSRIRIGIECWEYQSV